MSTPDGLSSTGRSSAALARSSALMASGTLVSRVLGLVRVILLAAVLGLLESPVGNAWQTANTLPNTIYILLAGGVLNVVLVPSLTRAMAMSHGGREFTDRLITLILLALTGVTVVFTAGAALLTKAYALSWTGDQLALAVAFAYLCLPQIFCYGLYTLLGQILNAQERFGWYMWAPVVNNVVAIGGLLVFGRLYPEARSAAPGDWTAPMVWLLAGSATLGVLLQAVVLFWPVWRSGFRWRPRWGFRGVGLGAASRMALWMLAVIGLSQAGMWLSTNVLNRASELNPGASGKIIYENAFLFYILPHSLIATSLITAMFPRLSRAAHAEDLPSLGVQYGHGLRLLGVAMIPISLALLVLAPSLTATLLLGNTPAETQATAWVMMAMVVGLAPYAVYILSGRVFHAFQDGRTPFKMQMAITTVSVIGILIAATLPPQRTAIGIALAQTGGQSLAAVLGLWWVRRRLGGLGLGDVRRTYTRVLLAAAVAVVPALLVVLASRWLPGGRLTALLVLLAGSLVFFGTYGALAHRLGVRELAEVGAPLLRRLGLRRGRRSTAVADTAIPLQAPEPREEASAGLAWSATASPPADPVGPSASTSRAASPNRAEHGVQGIEAGTQLGGRYVLEELLAARGDTLDYWSARDSTLDRLVAVTVLPSQGRHAAAAQVVLDAARRVAGVDDIRLVRVLDVGEEDGLCWIVEEGLLDARSLASLVEEGPLPPEEARRIVGETAAALESARRRGLHHLYLNPHAVLRTRDGGVKVSGVAVAAAIEQTEDIPAAEATVIDTADLVSLLYTGLTATWPGEEMEGLPAARRLTDGSLPAPSEVVPGVPGDLDNVCRMVLASDYDPRQGPDTPGALAQQLSPWSPEVVQPGSHHRMTAYDADRPPPVDRRSAAMGATAATAGSGFSDEPGEDVLDLPRRDGPQREPAGASRRDGPSRLGTGIVLLLIAAIVGTGIFLATRAFRDSDVSPSSPTGALSTTDKNTSPTTTDTSTQTATPPPEATATPGEPLEIAGITSYDPQGDGDEHNDLVARAIDGDLDTAWNSRTYLSPKFSGIKKGVGLAVDLGEPKQVSEVEINFPEGGDYGVRVYVSDEEKIGGATKIATSKKAEGDWVVTADEPVTGRYVMIWFYRAASTPKGEIIYVSEITVR